MEDKYELDNLHDKISDIVDAGTNKLVEVENKVKAAKHSASSAFEKAQKALNEPPHLFLQGKPIEKLKEASYEMAEALNDTIEAQIRMQEYQRILTLYTTDLFKLSVINIAAGDAAIEKLKEITSQKKLSNDTKKQTESIIDQIKNQQSLVRRIEQAEENLRKQKISLNELSAKINNISIINIDGTQISDESKIVLSVFKESLNDMISVSNSNNDTIREIVDTLHGSSAQETAKLLGDNCQKYENFTSMYNEKTTEICNSLLKINSVILNSTQILYDKTEQIKSSITFMNSLNNDFASRTDESFKKLEEREKKNSASIKKFEIITYILFGVIVALVITCLFLIIFR